MKHPSRFLLAVLAAALSSCTIRLDFGGGGSSSANNNSTPSSSSVMPKPSSSTPIISTEGKTVIGKNYRDLNLNNVYNLDCCPSTGNAKLLVIPIWFTDSSDCILPSKRENVREDIQKTYFGSPSDTGWHSVKSYYEAESFGKLNLSGTVSEWYECGKPSSAFASQSNGKEATLALLPEAVDWYFANHTSDARRNYDSDANGHLDGVMLIYAALDYGTSKRGNETNLWAYCSWLQHRHDQESNLLNPTPNVFFWASYDFMYDSVKALERTGKPYGGGDTSRLAIDAHTFIHEMGHVFGLVDYYDYGEGKRSPAAGFSMQDQNVGGHDPYSVMAFGWADPYIPESSMTITLRPFQENHDLLLLTNKWNEYNSPFDEYILVELYTPTGLNEADSIHQYGNKCAQGPMKSGLRVWHVDSRLVECLTVVGGNPVYSDSNITTKPLKEKGKNQGVALAFSNSFNSPDYGTILGSSYDNFDLLRLIKNSSSSTLADTDNLKAADLFSDSKGSFNATSFSKQFPKGEKMNDGSTFAWTFDYEIAYEGLSVVAKIDLKRA